MAKDPAFLFYSSDFLTGTALFTYEQIGKYIKLLCLQHQQGHLHEQDMSMICGTHDLRVWAKFVKDADGLYFNERLEEEILRRKNYSESRRNNRKGDGNKNKKPLKRKPRKAKDTSESYVEHMETETETETKLKLVLPFETELFKSNWETYKKFRKEKHKFEFISLISEQAALKELGEMSSYNEEIAIKIIHQTLAKGWKGLFELKNNNNGNSAQQPASTVQTGLDKIDAMYRANK